MELYLNNEPLERTENDKLLGVFINCNFSWSTHVNYICGILCRKLALLRRIRHLLPLQARKIFYTSYILPTLDYCCMVWGNCEQFNIQKLIRLQKQSVRLVNGSGFYEYTSPIYVQFKWLPLDKRLHYHTGVQMYKIYHKQCSEYLSSLFNLKNNKSRTLRSTSNYTFSTPKIRQELYRRSLSYSGALHWINIPLAIQTSPSLQNFKSNYYKYMLCNN